MHEFYIPICLFYRFNLTMRAKMELFTKFNAKTIIYVNTYSFVALD